MSTPAIMRAYRLPAWQSPPELVRMPLPEPGPGEVRLKVAGNGLCRSDLHMIHDWRESPPHLRIRLPQTLGHEIGGWVDALGPGVSGWSLGQPVLVTLAGCGRCPPCLTGWNNYCREGPRQPGIDRDGGLADYVLAPVACLVACEGLDPVLGAPLTDAGLSSYHAVRRVASLLRPGTLAVVIGAGGLGHLAIAALRAVTAAEILAIDPDPAARELALTAGAHLALAPDEPCQPCGEAMAVLDFVGSGETLARAADMIRPLGHIVVVGRGKGSFPLRHDSLPYGATLSTTFGGSRAELQELVTLAKQGIIRPHVTTFPLSQVAEAFQALVEGKIRGRAVVVPEAISIFALPHRKEKQVFSTCFSFRWGGDQFRALAIFSLGSRGAKRPTKSAKALDPREKMAIPPPFVLGGS